MLEIKAKQVITKRGEKERKGDMLDSVPGSGMIYLEFYKLCKQTAGTGSWYAD